MENNGFSYINMSLLLSSVRNWMEEGTAQRSPLCGRTVLPWFDVSCCCCCREWLNQVGWMVGWLSDWLVGCRTGPCGYLALGYKLPITYSGVRVRLSTDWAVARRCSPARAAPHSNTALPPGRPTIETWTGTGAGVLPEQSRIPHIINV